MTPPKVLQPQDAVRQVQKLYPPGTVIRNRATSTLYTVGEKSGLSKFWLARIPDDKISEHATRILMAYEKVSQ